MFGLAGRTDYLRIETRARNAVTTTFPDADRSVAMKASIVPGADAMMFGPHTATAARGAWRPGSTHASRAMPEAICATI